MQTVVFALSSLVWAPLLGGLVSGIDRRLTARFQSRIGPPLMQPFYDVVKLMRKEKSIVNAWQAFCAFVYLAAAGLSVVLFFLQSDLLLIFFVEAVSSVFLVVGALSAASPYSRIGAHRELIQLLTSKSLLVFVIVGIALETGSFKIASVYAPDRPLLLKLPLLFLVLGVILTLKLRKSPLDFSASHHAHQEIVRGVLTEYSGPYLALIEIGHWYETILVLGFCSLFWATSLTGMILLPAILYLFQIWIDNVSARLTWRWMLGPLWTAGLILSVVNLIWLYAG